MASTHGQPPRSEIDGFALKRELRARNWSAHVLAARAGLAPARVRKMLSHGGAIDDEIAEAIAKVLGVNRDRIVI